MLNQNSKPKYYKYVYTVLDVFQIVLTFLLVLLFTIYLFTVFNRTLFFNTFNTTFMESMNVSSQFLLQINSNKFVLYILMYSDILIILYGFTVLLYSKQLKSNISNQIHSSLMVIYIIIECIKIIFKIVISKSCADYSFCSFNFNNHDLNVDPHNISVLQYNRENTYVYSCYISIIYVVYLIMCLITQRMIWYFSGLQKKNNQQFKYAYKTV